MISKKKLFVTVGTTKFPKLVDLFTTKPFVDSLVGLEYQHVQLQAGREFGKPKIDSKLEDVRITKENQSVIVNINSSLTLRYDPYFEKFEEEILKADLVISHAGAGTCLDVLRRKKKLIVVINEDLMDNHQVELAETLQEAGYLYYCTCETLIETLNKDFSKLKEYPKAERELFAKYLDKCMGFIN